MRRMGDTLGQGLPEKNASFWNPPPPTIKRRTVRGSGIQSQPLMKVLVPQPFRCMPSLYPIPDPPPPLKEEQSRGYGIHCQSLICAPLDRPSI
jgi:hypothetical protein